MFERFFQLTDKTIDISKDILGIWREKIFSVIFITSLIVASFPYIYNVKIGLTTGLFINIFIYSSGYIIALLITFNKSIPFSIRAWIGLSLFYIMGLISLITIGPSAAGRMWLLIFAVLTTLLLGLKAGVVTLFLNSITIIIWALGWSNDNFIWSDKLEYVPNQAVATVFSFLFMNLVVTISIGIFVVVLKERFEREKALFNDLRLSNERLEKENQERRMIEQALRENEKRYREVVENMGTGVAVFEVIGNGDDFIFKDINSSGARIGKTSREEHLGRSVQEVYPGIHKMGLFKIFQSVWRSGKAERFPIKTYKDNHLNLWVENYVFKLSAGEIVSVYDDISERIKAEEEREKLEQQLQQAQKMEAIGTLAGGIAHDFNNILSPIIIYSEMIMMDLPRDTPHFHNIKQIYKSSMRARELVKQILTFSRKGKPTLTPIKIIPIIKDSLKMLRSSLPVTIEIIQNMETKNDTVLGDPTQIHQILMNICTNASHAMELKGGILEVRLSEEDIDEEVSTIHPDVLPGSYLKLSVKDTGYGMDEKTMEKIFEPYFTTKEQGRGTGLGLSVVHGIVKDYGGFINVESKPGKGTTIDVILPKVIEDIPTTSEPLDQLLKGSESILFVDDEKTAVDAMESMLGILGYRVETRTSSIEALKVFQKRPYSFDLIITDMTMPNMTGKDLAEEILKIRPDIPIILCTGYSEMINEEQARKIGIRTFVMKPLILREIARTIRDVLENR